MTITLWLIITIAINTPNEKTERLEFQNSNDCAKAAALVERYSDHRAKCVREYDETVRG